MTPERARLLEAVAEVAERALAEWDKDAIMHVSPLRDALAALCAHDASPQVEGETVELRIDAWKHRQKDRWVFELADSAAYTDASGMWNHIATITARVPLPVVPVIAATVTAAKEAGE